MVLILLSLMYRFSLVLCPFPQLFYSFVNEHSLMLNRHFVCYFIQVTKDGHPIIFHDDLIIYNEKVNIMD